MEVRLKNRGDCVVEEKENGLDERQSRMDGMSSMHVGTLDKVIPRKKQHVITASAAHGKTDVRTRMVVR